MTTKKKHIVGFLRLIDFQAPKSYEWMDHGEPNVQLTPEQEREKRARINLYRRRVSQGKLLFEDDPTYTKCVSYIQGKLRRGEPVPYRPTARKFRLSEGNVRSMIHAVREQLEDAQA